MKSQLRISLLALSLLLAACGGGGGSSSSSGKTLVVTVTYTGNANLYQQSKITPKLTGFDGAQQHCTAGLASFGSKLPNGMVLNDDCSILGVPTEAGSFSLAVTVGADGATGTYTTTASFNVIGPSLDYQPAAFYSVGETVSLSPTANAWQLGAGQTLKYFVSTGAMPPGLTIDAATGKIAGTPTGKGGVTAVPLIAVEASNGSSKTTLTQTTALQLSIASTGFSYGQATIKGWVGLPLVAKPVSLPTGTENEVNSKSGLYSFELPVNTLTNIRQALPAGVVLNAVSGELGGSATTELISPVARWIGMFGNAGKTGFEAYAPVRLQFALPASVKYPTITTKVGTSLVFAPLITDLTTGLLAGTSYKFSWSGATALPSGLVLNPTTGVISGAAGAPFSLNVLVRVDGTTASGGTFTATATGFISATN